MNPAMRCAGGAIMSGPVLAAMAALFGLAATSAHAQGSGSGAATSSPAAVSTPAPEGPGSLEAPGTPAALSTNPYYVGVSQGLTYDSNATRTPNANSDVYSITSLFGGFNQPISRQRIYASGSVSENRYRDSDQLNNTSYNLAAGLDWQTVEKLSGNVNLALGQNRAAPVAGAQPTTSRNLSKTQSIDTRVRWGGDGLLSLEAGYGHSKVDYSNTQFNSLDSTGDTASVAMYYRPGASLRLGLGLRADRKEIPQAPGAGGALVGNSTRGKNIDLLADYTPSGLVTASGRLSYTRQTNSAGSGADFSGLTGNLNLGYRITGKTGISFNVARNSSFDSSVASRQYVTFFGPIPLLTSVTGVYQNNQITDSTGLGVTYAATGKITAKAGLSYARAKLVTSFNSQNDPDTTDVLKSAYLAADWAIARNWGASCSLTYEKRDVSGGLSYSYSAHTVGCLGRYTWP